MSGLRRLSINDTLIGGTMFFQNALNCSHMIIESTNLYSNDDVGPNPNASHIIQISESSRERKIIGHISNQESNNKTIGKKDIQAHDFFKSPKCVSVSLVIRSSKSSKLVSFSYCFWKYTILFRTEFRLKLTTTRQILPKPCTRASCLNLL